MADVQDNGQPSEPQQQRRGSLLALPTELIHAILLSLPPLCIEHYSQTCKLARQHVYGQDRAGDVHLWKNLYLQRFDNFSSLWDPPSDESSHHAAQDSVANTENDGSSVSSSPPRASSSVASSSTKRDRSSVMSLVQLRDRAARLYAGDPSDHGPLSLNFNAVLTALLSVIDTAVPEQYPNPCRNTTWLSDSILASGQSTWSQWVFPRSVMCTLDEFKSESTSRSGTRSKSPQERKRRRLSVQNQSGPSSLAAEPSSSRHRSQSKLTNGERPDSVRRRSARLLKLMYPEALHPLVDRGIDIDSLAQPQMRLAARIHCLHGIRAWKDSQKQRLTESPQEIPGQTQQDGLANQGAAQAQHGVAAADEPPPQQQNSTTPAQDDSSEAHERPESWSGENDQEEEEEQEEENDSDDDDSDDESFDEPPAVILRHRPRMFGPSFGFCNAPDEEDEVRARMRHRVYDSGYYGWSNGYAPLHAWRRPSADPQARNHGDSADEEAGEDDDNDVNMADAARGGFNLDGDDDAIREAVDFSDDDIPDDPVPIEIEVSTNGSTRRTFQVADRFGNLVNSSHGGDRPAAVGWDSSDDQDEATPATYGNGIQRDTDRTPYQPPALGSYDADTLTFTYEGDLPIGIITGRDNIQVTVGDTVDFIARGELNVRFVRPGMLDEVMRVTSGLSGAGALGDDGDDPIVAQEDDEGDQEGEDDDFDEDADDWDDEEDFDDDDDDQFGPFGAFRPMAAAVGYRGCRADDEIKHLLEQHDKEADDKDKHKEERVCLRKKAIHWELVEAIMVVMYANLKEAIWLENWGVGIKIPKIYDQAGVLAHDPMEKREFLEFPTGWISSLPNPVPAKLSANEASSDEQQTESPPRANGVTNGAQDDEKPHDWARCESFWGGSYSFLDFSHFVDFNVRLARQRRQALSNAGARSNGANGKAPAQQDTSTVQSPRPNLIGQEEAVGDCLQLRLELLPKSQQPAYNSDEEGQEDDDEYPTLFFRGTTVTYWGNEAPMPRGGVHGKVRPVYAREEDVDEIMSKGPRGKKKIEGLHWSLTHVHDGEDRWQLEGIQPGPPGTRAPIFGIWSDALHEEESPNGPFVYWMMDERPWRDIERLNREEAHAIAAARAANGR
ncbi:hypothetical protein EX895_001499 [Sporisorium graminicola]|uniref:F-box domain-containing protein n=1 Tax=Sporisorium graminicola TaxID=280036 RepID=A0A4U7KXZ2_9BASI|nr:hypothetical protein EX895_001499 [Sporisorium graminicola]TKY89714.1 hypothetical protein EX895_001499 [Sporisorium graminicola]